MDDVLAVIDRLVIAYETLPQGQRCILTGRILQGLIQYILDKIVFGPSEDIEIDREVFDELCDEDRYKCFDDTLQIKDFCNNFEKLVAVKDALELGPTDAAREYKKGGYFGEELSNDEMERLVNLMSGSRTSRNRK
jgi:hypothetical protein